MLASWGLGNPELGVLMLGLFVVFIMFGFPIAFTLMALGFGFGYFAMGDIVFALVVQRAYSVMTNDTLVAIPLFVFMGYIIERANILDRLFHSIQIAVGGLPGSLAIATLMTCAMFATATGIVGAVVTLMGLLAFPAMLRAGYDVRLSAGVVCAGEHQSREEGAGIELRHGHARGRPVEDQHHAGRDENAEAAAGADHAG
jgi:TRAP-type mannitol/chloroaromatic compound transport system permease large subunit